MTERINERGNGGKNQVPPVGPGASQALAHPKERERSACAKIYFDD